MEMGVSSTMQQPSPLIEVLKPLNPVNERFIPRPSSTWITDKQISHIAAGVLVLLGVLLIFGPVTAVLGGGCAVAAVIVTIVAMGILIIGCDSTDPQKCNGAATIRKDLQNLSLIQLKRKYDFKDLAYYGYISPESASKMSKIYACIPVFTRIYENHYREYVTDSGEIERDYEMIYDERQSCEQDTRLENPKKRIKLNTEFELYRLTPDFILYSQIAVPSAPRFRKWYV